jgi:hypothetical protein
VKAHLQWGKCPLEVVELRSIVNARRVAFREMMKTNIYHGGTETQRKANLNGDDTGTNLIG